MGLLDRLLIKREIPNVAIVPHLLVAMECNP
jgi:hypothetical protein